ncbi:pathogenesis-related protein PR-1-like [Humulus lupulus]|uniref:pathogenesis-related protein PR-1-like n=1 Tax=Humulus lupulus TaxID=3486 RepID=UPI002B411209|nr:pathogenesis-related protein PR-1-like [Humulus lupulus]
MIKSLLSSLGLLTIFLTFSLLFSITFSLPTHNIPSSHQLTTTSYTSTTIDQFLTPQNILRSKIGLPPLRWSKRLANYPYWWANQRRGDCTLVHSGGDYGENLFWGSGKDWSPGEAVAAWGDERRYYDHYSNSCVENQECLHYTQIVWRHTMKVGCAKVTCWNGDIFISCNYDPHGNVIGQRPF